VLSSRRKVRFKISLNFNSEGEIQGIRKLSVKALPVIAALKDGQLLLEIGLHRTNPYSRHRGNDIKVTPRKAIGFDKQTYTQIAPCLFKTLEKYAQDCIKKRKCDWDNMFYVSGKRLYYKRRGGSIQYSKHWTCPPFITVHVSCFDTALAGDLMAQWLYGREAIHQRVGLANFIERALVDYPQNGRSLDRFRNLKGGRVAAEALLRPSLHPILQKQTLRILSHNGCAWKEYPHIHQLLDICNLSDWTGELTTEERLAKQGPTGRKERLGHTRIDYVGTNGNNHIFRFFPKKPESNDIPF